MRKRVRVGAYAVCVRDGAVLLARYRNGAEWTLPGGGLDHGEQPHDGAVREVEEETGYHVRLDALLTVDSVRVQTHHVPPYDLHGVRIIYAATIIGGALRFEVDGSTDRAAWIPLAEVLELPRESAIDVGLAAWERYLTAAP